MKITRSTKCSLKFLSVAKRDQLDLVMAEYSRAVNFFIHEFWRKSVGNKDLLADVLIKFDSWISARLKKNAGREAIAMIASSIEMEKEAIARWNKKNAKKKKPKPEQVFDISKLTIPKHSGQRMCLSETNVRIDEAKTSTLFGTAVSSNLVSPTTGLVVYGGTVQYKVDTDYANRIGRQWTYGELGAAYNYQYVANSSESLGVHNPVYVMQLLQTYIDYLNAH